MTSIKANLIGGNAQVNPNDLGSVGNRIEYVGKEIADFKKFQLASGLTMAGGAAATAVATNAVKNSPKLQKVLTDFGKKIMDNKYVKQAAEELSPIAKKCSDYVKNLPKPAKAVLAAGALITGLTLESMASKKSFESGKNYQEHVDKAKVQDILG